VLEAALVALAPEPLDGELALLGYPRGHAPDVTPDAGLALRIDDPWQTSLVVPLGLVGSLPPPAVLIEPLRAIVLPGELPHELTGFIAALSGALARAGVPIVPIGAASRDHLLVPADRLDDALATLAEVREDAAATLVVRRWWELMEAREWDDAAECLAPDIAVEWTHTGERFAGREAVVRVNREYPQGWAIRVLDIVGGRGRVAADVEVTHGAQVFRCAQFATVVDGAIVEAVEHWVTCGGEAVPPDRG
jgi:SnoaL-like domain/ACT domain